MLNATSKTDMLIDTMPSMLCLLLLCRILEYSIKPNMLSVVMLNVIMVSVAAPLKGDILRQGLSPIKLSFFVPDVLSK
jgi:hypothetical protein